MPSWYEIKAKADSAEVYLYDEIGGWGIGAKQFIDELRDLDGKPIALHIHSPGGSVLDGHAIYNALNRHNGRVTVQIDGLAASMASIVALAGSPVKMAENGFFMIHNPHGASYGEADDMRKAADLLDKMTDGLVNIYAAKTKKKPKEIEKMMAEETWFTAAEALAEGFIDEITDAVEMAAITFDTTKFKHAPRALIDTKPKTMATTTLEISIEELGKLRTELAEAQAQIQVAKVLDTKNGEAFAKLSAEHDALTKQFEKVSAEFRSVTEDNAKLKAEVDAMPVKINEAMARELAARGHPAPIATAPQAQGTTTNIIEQYNAISNPADRVAFYRKHKAEFDAAYKSQS